MIALMNALSPELKRLRRLERAVKAMAREMKRANCRDLDQVNQRVVRDLFNHANVPQAHR